jgi:nitronate monooxygenase
MVLDRVELPIVLAPLAGGPSTPALTATVSEAGGLGLLATGYLSAAQTGDAIAKTRELTSRPFGINLFVPGTGPSDPRTYADYIEGLRAWANARRLPVGSPEYNDDDWDAKLELAAAHPVSLVTFTFGCPDAATFALLRDAGSETWVTVTSPDEARQAEAAGADALVVQGAEAGGHRASFVDHAGLEPISLLPLLQEVRRAVRIPLVATGGLATGEGVAAVLAAGARAAQLGTAFMLCPEAGTSSAHRDAIASDEPTELTRAFSGRLARGIRNGFMTEHVGAPVAYPEIHYVTAPLRRRAREQGDADTINLWAGEAHALAQAVPAAEVVARIAAEADSALAAARKHLPRGKSGDDSAAANSQNRESLSELATRWYEDWNAHDLERILSHYTDDVVFSSPLVAHLDADPSGTLVGKDALRAYWSDALERYPEMHFEPVDETHGVRSLVLHYRVDGIRACEMLEIDDSGLVARSLAHYEPPLPGDA